MYKDNYSDLCIELQEMQALYKSFDSAIVPLNALDLQ